MKNELFEQFYLEKKKEALFKKQLLLPIFYTACYESHNLQLIFFPWGLEHLQLLADFQKDGQKGTSYVLVDGRVIEIPFPLYQLEQHRQQLIWKTIKQYFLEGQQLETLEPLNLKIDPLLKSYSIPENNAFGTYTKHLVKFRKDQIELEKQKFWLNETAKEKEVLTSFQYKPPFVK